MKRTKEQKGITLIALIITIVVLLILAAVAISSISNDGILHYAQNAADNWNKASQNEAETLDSYLSYFCKINGHKWEETDEYSENYDWLPVCMCSACGLKCEHSETEWVNGGAFDDWQCAIDEICAQCGYIIEAAQSLVPHEYDASGNCTVCGWQCSHEYTTPTYTPSTEGCVVAEVCDGCGKEFDSTIVEHEIDENNISCAGNANECIANVTCSNCGAQGTKTESSHNFGYDGICKNCRYECEHESYTDGWCNTCGAECDHEFDYEDLNYSYFDYCQHYVDYRQFCEVCGYEMYDSAIVDCTYDSNGTCTVCGEGCSHPDGLTNITYSANGDECIATGNCSKCGATGTIIEEHELDESNLTYSANGDECIATGNCSKCGTTGTRIEEHGFEWINYSYVETDTYGDNTHETNVDYYCPKCKTIYGSDWWGDACTFDSNGKCTLCGGTKQE